MKELRLCNGMEIKFMMYRVYRWRILDILWFDYDCEFPYYDFNGTHFDGCWHDSFDRI